MTRSSLGGTLSPSAFGFAAGPGIEDLEFQPDRAGSRLHVGPQDLGACCIGRVDEYGHTSGLGHQLMESIKPFGHQPRAAKPPRRR
jgi:hypothetical protein